jgi:hypothetical protein
MLRPQGSQTPSMFELRLFGFCCKSAQLSYCELYSSDSEPLQHIYPPTHMLYIYIPPNLYISPHTYIFRHSWALDLWVNSYILLYITYIYIYRWFSGAWPEWETLCCDHVARNQGLTVWANLVSESPQEKPEVRHLLRESSTYIYNIYIYIYPQESINSYMRGGSHRLDLIFSCLRHGPKGDTPSGTDCAAHLVCDN